MRRTAAITCLLAGCWLLLATDASAGAKKLGRKLTAARQAYENLFPAEGSQVPPSLLEQARCVAVIPDLVKGAVGIGGKHGTGAVSCRSDTGEWGPPAFLTVSGGSLGLQIGVESTDLVLFFTGEDGARSLISGGFTVGGDLSVAAGPSARSTGASADLNLEAEVYAYGKSSGLFVGASFEGARLSISDRKLLKYYGERLWPEQVLFAHDVAVVPPEAQAFRDALR